MRFFGAFLSVSILLYFGGFATAEASCEQRLEVSRDGSISDWVVCYNDKPMTVTGADGNFLQLDLTLGDDNQELALDWTPVPSKDDEIKFIGTDDRNQIKIARTYQQISGTELSHTVRISGLPKASTPQVRLRLMYGALDDSKPGLRTTFADMVYGFRRTYVSEDGQSWSLADVGAHSNHIAIYSRHKVVIVESTADLELGVSGLALLPDPVGTATDLMYRHRIIAISTQTPNLVAAGYDDLMFVDLWRPLSVLSKWIEAFLISTSRLIGGVGPAIILLALAIRFVTYPVSLWAARKQHEYSLVADRINPLIADIRNKYKGAEQSERILAVYSENKISPFSGLKGSIGLFVQIPFLLAVFNVTTSSSIFAGESFLWIADLSQADQALLLPFFIPLLGSSINVLPLILGAVNIFFADTTSGSTMSTKWTPIVISILIVLVFYSFCAAVVLYWLAVNMLQVIERHLQARFEWLNK